MTHHRSIFAAALCALILMLSACDRRSGDAAPAGGAMPPASAASR